MNHAFKNFAISLPLFFIGPPVIYNAFQNQDNAWHYLVLGVGIAICFFAVFFAFKGLNSIMKTLFKNDQ